jgi:spore coat protein U-like protein
MNNLKFSGIALSMIAAFAVLASGAASAGTLDVSASIAPECAVAQTLAINFGNLTMLNGATAQQSAAANVHTGTIDAICTNGTPNPTFQYESANTTGANFQLIGGTDASQFIAYSVHQDATGATAAVTYNTAAAYPGFVADGTTKSLSITAKILPAAKNGKLVQAYSDVITITTSFDS